MSTMVNGYEIKPGANLYDANLRSANLRSANLYDANLRSANLRSANLYDANLRSANLRSADLYGANLRSANLRSADLYGAYLYGADLRGANLRGANLYGADLRGADLRGADLYDANLRSADLPPLRITPDGAFTAWKACRNGVVVKLEIPADAKRSNATGRKCRAEYVKVLEVFGADEGIGWYDGSVIYRPGEAVRADGWDEDWTEECAQGIHFFITREEAENLRH